MLDSKLPIVKLFCSAHFAHSVKRVTLAGISKRSESREPLRRILCNGNRSLVMSTIISCDKLVISSFFFIIFLPRSIYCFFGSSAPDDGDFALEKADFI